MRRFVYAILLLLAVVFAVSQFREFEQSLETLRLGAWYWLVLALLMEVVYLVNLTATYRASFHMVGIEVKPSRLLGLVVAANFANVATASGGLAGIALLADEARRSGQSAARATVAGGIFVLSEYAAILGVLAVGFSVLLQRNSLTTGDLIAAGVLVLAALALSLLFVMGLRSSSLLDRALLVGPRLVNHVLRPVIKRDYVSEAAVHAFAADTGAAFQVMRRRPKGRWPVSFGLALSAKVVLIGVLAFVFLAFGQPLDLGTLVAGFSLAYLFQVVSPTPAGIGIVEGVMVLALRTLDIPLGAAAVITLSYRGLTFWLPFIAGFFAFRRLMWRKAPSLTPPAPEV